MYHLISFPAFIKYDVIAILIYLLGDDYDFGPYTVTFPAGMTSAALSILITDDEIYESDEAFYLNIDRLSLPPNVAVGDISQVTVNILNDDGNFSYSYICIATFVYAY